MKIQASSKPFSTGIDPSLKSSKSATTRRSSSRLQGFRSRYKAARNASKKCRKSMPSMSTVVNRFKAITHAFNVGMRTRLISTIPAADIAATAKTGSKAADTLSMKLLESTTKSIKVHAAAISQALHAGQPLKAGEQKFVSTLGDIQTLLERIQYRLLKSDAPPGIIHQLADKAQGHLASISLFVRLADAEHEARDDRTMQPISAVATGSPAYTPLKTFAIKVRYELTSRGIQKSEQPSDEAVLTSLKHTLPPQQRNLLEQSIRQHDMVTAKGFVMRIADTFRSKPIAPPDLSTPPPKPPRLAPHLYE